MGITQRNTSSGSSIDVLISRGEPLLWSRANVVIGLKRARANVVMLGAQRQQVGMVESQQILNGIDGHAGKLPSIILPCDQSPLLPFVLGVVESCSVAFRINHVAFICRH